jgi:hypothetical protein
MAASVPFLMSSPLSFGTVVLHVPMVNRTWDPFPARSAAPAAKVRRNPHAARIAVEGIVHVRRGRPRKGTEAGPTVPGSIRCPAPAWKQLEVRAKSKGLSLQSALLAAVLDWARRAP